MRTRAEVELVQSLAVKSVGRNEISRRTGVPRSTVVRWLNGGSPHFREPVELDAAAHAHLLGLYLGDGHIAAFPRTWCLRLYLDERYPQIVASAVRSVQQVAPHNRVAVHRRPGCVVVQCYANAWARLFPQHGPGPKHARTIRLEPWQTAITSAHAREFVRGLMESDGSRHINAVLRRGRTYAYPRYSFSNRSEDIKAIFCEHLERLDIAWRRASAANISIARREAVAALDEFVGPKC
jgi:hypothetical protein